MFLDLKELLWLCNMFMILLILLVFCSPLAVYLGVKQCFCGETARFKGWTHQGTQEAGLLHTPTLGRVVQHLTLFLTSSCPKFPGTFSVRDLHFSRILRNSLFQLCCATLPPTSYPGLIPGLGDRRRGPRQQSRQNSESIGATSIC